jgi:putative transposase
MIELIKENKLNNKLSCELLEIPESSYYESLARKLSKTKQRQAQLSHAIQVTFEAFKGIYGAPKIHQELLDQGISVGLKTVQKLMKQLGLKSVVMKKFRPGHSVSDSVSRVNLIASEPTARNQVWSTDITYIWTRHQGWCYLSTLMDRYTKKVLAWDFGRHMTTGLVVSTFEKAWERQGQPEHLILHSDQGSQYTSHDYETLLNSHKVRHSFSRKGYPYHNASLESWHGHLKREWIYQHDYKTFEEAKHDLFWYIEAFYNTKRKHQTLGYLTPEQFEQKIA